MSKFKIGDVVLIDFGQKKLEGKIEAVLKKLYINKVYEVSYTDEKGEERCNLFDEEHLEFIDTFNIGDIVQIESNINHDQELKTEIGIIIETFQLYRKEQYIVKIISGSQSSNCRFKGNELIKLR